MAEMDGLVFNNFIMTFIDNLYDAEHGDKIVSVKMDRTNGVVPEEKEDMYSILVTMLTKEVEEIAEENSKSFEEITEIIGNEFYQEFIKLVNTDNAYVDIGCVVHYPAELEWTKDDEFTSFRYLIY